jgi:hypothetical protein
MTNSNYLHSILTPPNAEALRNAKHKPQWGQITDVDGEKFEIVIADAAYFASLLKRIFRR